MLKTIYFNYDILADIYNKHWGHFVEYSYQPRFTRCSSLLSYIRFLLRDWSSLPVIV